MGALTMTKSASDIIVERGICELMWRSEAARHGWVEGLLGGGVLAPMRAVSQLSERRWSWEERTAKPLSKAKRGRYNQVNTMTYERAYKYLDHLRKGTQMGEQTDVIAFQASIYF